VDDFEVGDLSNYDEDGTGADLDDFTVQSSIVHTGNFALEAVTPNGDDAIYSDNPGGGNTPSFGEDFEFYVRAETSGFTDFYVGWLSDTQNSEFGIAKGFAIQFRFSEPVVRLLENVDGELAKNTSNITTSSLPIGVWIRAEVTYPGSAIKAELFNGATSLGSTSITPDTQGFGSHIYFFNANDIPLFFDDWRLL
jgi:hypothetical protein